MSSVCSDGKWEKHLHQGSGEEPPSAPDGFELPEKYRVKRCFFCKNWSTSPAPWDLRETPLKSWWPVLPWARGNRGKPVADVCKVCIIVTRLNQKKYFMYTILFFMVYFMLMLCCF